MKTNNIWKRLLALTIAMVMVLGYVPVGTLATDGDGGGEPVVTDPELKVTVTCKATSTEDPAEPPAEGGEGEGAGEGGEDPEPTPPTYTTTMEYGVTVMLGGQDITTTDPDVVISWDPAEEELETAKSATVTVTYQGKKLVVTQNAPEVADGSTATDDTEATWKAPTVAWVTNFVAGQQITEPTVTFEKTENYECGFASPVTWAVTNAAGEAVTAGDIAKVAMDTLTATATDATSTPRELTAPVVPATIEVASVAPAAEGWFKEDPKVVVTGKANGLTLEDCYDVVFGEGDKAVKWEKRNEDGTFEATFTPVSGTTYTIGGVAYTWNVDTLVPTVAINQAYVNNEDKLVVDYQYTVGASGGQVTLSTGGAEQTVTELSGTVKFDTWGDSVTATVKNGAGVTASANAMVNAFPSLNYNTNDFLKVEEGKGYVKHVAGDATVTEDKLTVTISNAVGNVTWYINDNLVADDNDATLVLDANTYKGSAPVIKAVDGLNRECSLTLPQIVIDDLAPEITVTPSVDPVPAYSDEEVTFTIAVSDLVKLGEACKVVATINGEDRTIADATATGATVTVKDGETLTKIVVTAVDAAGNEAVKEYETSVCVDMTAPVITASVAVKYMDGNGEYTIPGQIASLYNNRYMILDTVASHGANVETQKVRVVVTYLLTEANLDAAATSTQWMSNPDGTYRYVQSVDIAPDEVKDLALYVTAVDKVGKVCAQANVSVANGSNPALAMEKGEDGSFAHTYTIDRRTPENSDNPLEIPEITIIPEGNSGVVGDVKYFGYSEGSDIILPVSVKDGASGLNVTDEDANSSLVAAFGETQLAAWNGIFNENVGFDLPADQESTEGRISYKVYDNVGNYYLYNTTFAVDTLAPRITVTDNIAGDNLGTLVEETGIKYFKNEVVINVNVEDLAVADSNVTITYSIDGKETTTNTSEKSFKLTLEDGMQLTALTIKAVDHVGNSSSYDYFADKAYAIEVDTTDAVIDIGHDHETKVVATADGVDYFTEDVTFTVKVTDKNRVTGTIVYTVDGETTEIPVDTAGSTDYTFTVTEGTVLTDVVVNVTDAALNDTEEAYAGNDVAVDNTPPSVFVAKVALDESTAVPYIQTVKKDEADRGKAYYNAGIKYVISIEDQFLNPASKILVNGKEAEVEIGALAAVDTLTFTYEVKDGAPLETIEITVVDMVGQTATEVATLMTATSGDVTFAKEGNVFTYTGPVAVVDTVAPVATLKLAGNIEKFFWRENENVYYIRLEQPAASTLFDKLLTSKETVSLTVTVDDVNLSLNNEVEHNIHTGNKKNKNWTINEEGTQAVYAESVTVALHKADNFEIDLNIFDLAGNPMVLKVEPINGTTLPVLAEDGNVTTTLSVDRRTPTSEKEDKEIPNVFVTDTAKENETKFVINGLDVFKGEFSFGIFAKDSESQSVETSHAGLQSVTWNVSDKAGVLESIAAAPELAEDTYSYTFAQKIPAPADETDDAAINVTAVDNVGNTIVYTKNFGIDNLAPRVTVTFSGQSVRNNQYYNMVRTATVVVEDMHLPDVTAAEFAQLVKIDTNGTAGTWTQDGDTYTIVYTFDNDGRYHFSMTAEDLLGNFTGNANVVYVGEIHDEFVIDRTAPVININYNPGTSDGRDNKGVYYYNEDLVVTATITEQNFSAADVISNCTIKDFVFRGWTAGINHVSTVKFTENNGYEFSLAYQDLAGNRATTYNSPTFSVDTHAPTIQVFGMEEDALNIVQGDLELYFEINDAQSNLSDYSITLTHLDNSFQKKVLTGSEYFSVVTVEDRTSIRINMENLAKEKLHDGLYTVEISAKDYATNSVSLYDLVYSLNRFGSTFTTEDTFTQDFLSTTEDGNAYHSAVDNKIVVSEINPNRIWQDESKTNLGSVLTIVVNGTATKLVEGEDYKLTETEQGSKNSKWYVYTYEIDPAVFMKDGELVNGRYSILFYSEDEAGNKNTNESNASGRLQRTAEGEYSGKIEFILDNSAPIITTVGIESGEIYNAEAQKMEIFVSDNTPTGIVVYLNGEAVQLYTSEEGLTAEQAWLVYNANTDSYVLNVPQQNTLFNGQEVKVVATDAANNSAEAVVDDFNVSTNLAVRLLNNGWFLGGVGVAALALIALVLKKKKIF